MISIDFETYFVSRGPNKYSLRGSTTEGYIRDPRFQVIGFSYAYDDGPATWVTGDDEHIASVLRSLKLEGHAVCAHNMMFDGAILSWVYGIHPKILVDTLSMAMVAGVREQAGGSLAKLAKLFDIGVKGEEILNADGLRREDFAPDALARYGEYCNNDTELCYQVYKKLRPGCSVEDMRITDMTLRMFTRPIFTLNADLLATRLTTVLSRKEAARTNLAEQLGVTPDELGTLLRSADKFTGLLQAHGVVVGMKTSPTDPDKQVPAIAKTDKFMDELLEHENPLVVVMAEGRLQERSNIEENRLERFLGIAGRGPLPIPLSVSGAHTHRYAAGGGINIQNLPKRGGRDLTLRRAITAPRGFKIVAADSSQIEVRTLAFMANHQRLLNTFAEGGDPYSVQAAAIYGGDMESIRLGAKRGDDDSKLKRAVGKEAVLSCGYQVGAVKFRDRLRTNGVIVSEDMAVQAVYGYRNSNPEITTLWRHCGEVLAAMAARKHGTFGGPDGKLFAFAASRFPGRDDESPFVRLPNGSVIWYHGLTQTQGDKGPQFSYWQGRYAKSIYSGKLVENLSQALAFAILKHQALLIMDAGVPVHMNVHDEWVSAVPDHLVDDAVNVYQTAMAHAPEWAVGLPLACEVGVADNYADV